MSIVFDPLPNGKEAGGRGWGLGRSRGQGAART